MALQDSNPERRNLSVLSFMLITYFIGGGSFPDNEISLQAVKMTFSRPDTLAAFVWVLFFWFLYRYWVVSRSSFSKEFNIEINESKEEKFIERYISSVIDAPIAPKTGDKHINETGMVIQRLGFKDGTLSAQVVNKILRRDGFGNVQSEEPVKGKGVFDQHLPFKGVKGRLTTLRLILVCSFGKPSFSSYIIPYIYSIVVVALAINQFIFNEN